MGRESASPLRSTVIGDILLRPAACGCAALVCGARVGGAIRRNVLNVTKCRVKTRLPGQILENGPGYLVSHKAGPGYLDLLNWFRAAAPHFPKAPGIAAGSPPRSLWQLSRRSDRGSATISPGKTWLPLNVTIVANDRGDTPSSYRARALGTGHQKASRSTT